MKIRALLFTLSLAALVSPSANAAIRFYDAFYTMYYSQTSTAAPTDYYTAVFASRVIGAPGDLTRASVRPPATPAPLAMNDLGGGYFIYRSPDFTTIASCLAAYPAGPYAFAISGGTQGAQNASLSRPAPIFCTEIPAFDADTFDAMQAGIDSTSDFNLFFNTFNPVSGSNTSLVFVTLFDQADGSVPVDVELDAFAGSAVIPAGTLLPGHSYDAVLYFSSRQEFTSAGFFGATSIAGFDRATSAPLVVAAICAADFNHDNTVDFFDYLDFVDAFSINADSADFNGDSVIDFFDYLDFVDAFSIGC